MKPTSYLTGAVVAVSVLTVGIVSGESERDVVVHALSLACLVLAAVFLRRVLHTNGAWLALGRTVLNIALFVLMMRVWDLAADLPDLGVVIGGNPESFEYVSKLGERIAFVATAFFVLRAIRELHQRLQLELRGE